MTWCTRPGMNAAAHLNANPLLSGFLGRHTNAAAIASRLAVLPQLLACWYAILISSVVALGWAVQNLPHHAISVRASRQARAGDDDPILAERDAGDLGIDMGLRG